MRGYSYQVLRSVLSWIELPEGDVLYLEGAEDLDQVAQSSATTTQIKDTRSSSNVTLRSSTVLKAINNYWSHRERNPGRQIRFRYLTTSEIGSEQGDPLGRGLPGIELWHRAKRSDDTARQTTDLEALKAFLLTQRDLSASLKTFLPSCSNEAFLKELIAPIDWETAAGDVDATLEAIRTRLVAFGSTRSVPARDAEVVVGPLYLEVWRVATRDQERSLDRAAFQRLFDDNTQVSIPKAQYTALVAQLLPGGGESSPLPAVIGNLNVIESPPPLPPRYYRRETALAQIAAAAARSPIIVLQGSTGMSKTTTATAFAAGHDRPWGWLNLRGYDAQSARRHLSVALAFVSGGFAPLNIVIDDLDTSTDHRTNESLLAQLASAQQSRGGLLILTVAQDPPQRLMQALNLSPDRIIRMPRFARGEIDGFLAASGCTDPTRRAAWAGIMELKTLGHPQLVHARVAALETAGYPQPTANDLLATPGDVLDARAEARKLLVSLDPPSRELIYRLSLTTHLLSRAHILAAAEFPPAVDQPGNALDRLIGPWLEAVAVDRYRISPLIQNAGQDVNGDEWAQRAQRGIAWALLRGRTLTPDDVSAILIHALAARDEAAIVRLAFGLFTAESEVWRAIGDAAFWLVHIGVEGNLDAILKAQTSLFLFRLMQLRVAVATESETAPLIVERFLTEVPGGDATVPARLARHVLLSEALFRPPPSAMLFQLLNWALEYIRASDSLGEVLAAVRESDPDPQFVGPGGSFDFACVAGFCVLQRVGSKAELAELLTGLRQWEETHLRRTLWICRHELLTRLPLDRVWLHEFQSQTPAWPEVLRLHEEVYALARRCGIDGLAIAAANIICRIIDENLNDPESALRRVEAFASELGDSPQMQDCRARVLASLGDDAGALAQWRLALPNWQTDDADLAPSFSYRLAARAAARVDRWSEAAELLTSGANRAGVNEPTPLRIGMLIDSGFAYLKAGDNSHAVDRFAAGLQQLDRVQSDAMAEPIYSLQKRVGHTLMWVQASSSGKPPAKFSEPPPACCSSLDPMTGEQPDQTPIDFPLLDLVRFERVTGVSDEHFRAYADRLRTSPYITVRVVALETIVQWRVRHLHTAGFLTDVAALVRTLAVAQDTRTGGEAGGLRKVSDVSPSTLTTGHDEMMRSYSLRAVFAIAARGLIDDSLIASWREEVAAANVGRAFDAWLDLLEGLFVSGMVNAEATLRCRDIDWTMQCLASLRVSMDDAIEPSLLIWCHGLWLRTLGHLPDREWIGDEVAALVANGWTRCADRPFLLSTPRTSVPKLREAIAVPDHGWSRAKRIIAAALNAVRYDAGTMAREALAACSD